MNFRLKQMSQEDAETIAEWEYEEPFSFYNPKSDEEDLQLLLDPKTRQDVYFSVYDNDRLIGFYTFIVEKDSVDIGLGMRPDLTGKGQGKEFVTKGLKYAIGQYQPNFLTLAVATFNERAIKVYERAGFIRQQTFMQETNGSTYEFLKMIKEL
jgi:[ribosomal protein S18]-alanine N-acetyltransferase